MTKTITFSLQDHLFEIIEKEVQEREYTSKSFFIVNAIKKFINYEKKYSHQNNKEVKDSPKSEIFEL